MPFIEGVPTVVVRLDRERELGFTNASVERVLRELGTAEVPDDPIQRVRALPTYLWACMDAESRAELSVDQISEMIHPGNAEALGQAISALFKASKPEAVAGASADPTPAGPKLATG